MSNLITPEGAIVPLGRHYARVQFGSLTGTLWRLDEIFHDGVQHMVRCSRQHAIGRVRRVFAPVVFGLSVQEEITRLHHALNLGVHAWQKVDEWFFAGIVALVPLAFFEQYHLAETITHALSSLTGGE